MPPYQASYINRNVAQLTPGWPFYLFGSYAKDTAPTRMNITSVSLTSPTAQVTGTVIEGQIPVVNQLISIAGAVPSYFNVTNAKITAVSSPATPDVGVYTVSFALTNANIGSTPSPGLAIAPIPEIGEAVPTDGVASCSVGLQSNVNPSNMRAIRFDVSFPSQVGSVDIVAQSAQLDEDSQYLDMGVVASMVGGVINGTAGLTRASTTFSEQNAVFVRALARNQAGISAATVVCKVTL